MIKESVTSASPIDYNYVGDDSKKNKSNKKLKKILIPNSKMANGFIIVFIIVAIITATTFPISSFMSGNLNAKIKIGFPLIFAELQMSGESSIIKMGNLIMDLIVYTLLAYIVNIILNFLSGITLFKKKIEVEEQPTIFKDQTITPEEKIIEKAIGK
ncbi:hypothetical protein KAS08_00040 [Candidatus Pacearchaeota archaeon]|nr:hypothetical protein [Candidatus Pacearchaeota archaeon]